MTLKGEIKGTFILRRGGRFFKVIKTRRTGGNWWTFECKDIESKQNRVFKYEMLGIYEALDSVASILPMNRKKEGIWAKPSAKKYKL